VTYETYPRTEKLECMWVWQIFSSFFWLNLDILFIMSRQSDWTTSLVMDNSSMV
jgi:hypothetical protein